MAKKSVSLQSQEFSVRWAFLARWTAREYFFRLWWWFAAIPISGVILLAVGRGENQLMTGLGMFGVLWPFTIPARAGFITRKPSRFTAKPQILSIEGDHGYLIPSDGSQGMRFQLSNLRTVTERFDVVALEIQNLRFVFVPTFALTAEQVKQLRKLSTHSD